MGFGVASRAISSPIGTAGAAAPYGMPTAGAANRRVQGGKFVPLSVFFLQMQGDAEDEDQQVTGMADKDDRPQKKGLGQASFSGSERNQTRGLKGARPKGKKLPPMPTMDEERGTSRFTGTASKPQKCHYCKSPATKSLIWADGRAYIPVCEEHESDARDQIVEKNGDEVAYVRKIDEDTTAANVAAYPVPIGRPLRRRPRRDKQDRKRWMDRLVKIMART